MQSPIIYVIFRCDFIGLGPRYSDKRLDVALTLAKNNKVKQDSGGKIINPHLLEMTKEKDNAGYAILDHIDIEADNYDMSMFLLGTQINNKQTQENTI